MLIFLGNILPENEMFPGGIFQKAGGVVKFKYLDEGGLGGITSFYPGGGGEVAIFF